MNQLLNPEYNDGLPGRLSEVEQRRLQDWESLVAEVVKDGNLEGVIQLSQLLQSAAKLVGLQLAKFLFMIQKGWGNFPTDESFESFCTGKLGYSSQTVRKYTSTWEIIFDDDRITPEQKEMLKGFPIQSLYLLKAAIQDGQLLDLHWEMLSQASTVADVRAVVRDARGSVASSGSALHIQLDPGGTLYAWRGDGIKKTAGYLSVESEYPDVQDAIDRLVRAANILR